MVTCPKRNRIKVRIGVRYGGGARTGMEADTFNIRSSRGVLFRSVCTVNANVSSRTGVKLLMLVFR